MECLLSSAEVPVAGEALVALRAGLPQLVHSLARSVAALGVVADHQLLVRQERSNLLLYRIGVYWVHLNLKVKDVKGTL